MSDEQPSDVLGALPRTRPHRRSDKRGAVQPAADQPTVAANQTAAPDGTGEPEGAAATGRDATASRPPGAERRPARTEAKRPEPARTEAKRPEPARTAPERPERGAANPVGTAVHAAAELAEIGLSISTWALRNALRRLPRP